MGVGLWAVPGVCLFPVACLPGYSPACTNPLRAEALRAVGNAKAYVCTMQGVSFSMLEPSCSMW